MSGSGLVVDTTSMADRIMDIAQLLVQTVGYNGFSYADIAQELGIRKATIHYYFRTKSELCASLLRRYRSRFRMKVALSVAGEASPRQRLLIYLSLYREALADGRLCPCGVLTGELLGLEPDIQVEVRGFFEEQMTWVEGQLNDAGAHRELRVIQPARPLAGTVFGMIQGGMLLARASGDPAVLAESIDALLLLIFS